MAVEGSTTSTPTQPYKGPTLTMDSTTTATTNITNKKEPDNALTQQWQPTPQCQLA